MTHILNIALASMLGIALYFFFFKTVNHWATWSWSTWKSENVKVLVMSCIGVLLVQLVIAIEPSMLDTLFAAIGIQVDATKPQGNAFIAFNVSLWIYEGNKRTQSVTDKTEQ